MKKVFVSLLLTAALLGSYAGLAEAGPKPPIPIPGGTNLPKYLQNVLGNYSGQAAYITSGGTVGKITADVELIIDQQVGQLFTGRLTITAVDLAPPQFTISGYVLKNGEVHFSGSLFNFPIDVRNLQKLEGRGQFKWVKGMRQISADYLISAFVGDDSPPVQVVQFAGGFLVDEQPLPE